MGINKPQIVKPDYMIDYTWSNIDQRVLAKFETDGYDFQYVCSLYKFQVTIAGEGTNWWGQYVKQDILKDYLYQDRMGSTTNLTDQFGRVVGRADYNEWGQITYSAALSITSSYRRIWQQLSCTGGSEPISPSKTAPPDPNG